MAREDWDLSHEYESHDHTGDDDREWFLELISHGVLFLAAIGLFTLAPWVIGLIACVAGLVLGLLSLVLKLAAAVLGLGIAAIALVVSLVLKLALFVVSFLAHPGVMLLILVIVLVRKRQ